MPGKSTGRKRILNQSTELEIVKLFENNSEITAKEVISTLRLNVSTMTIYRIVKRYSFNIKPTQYCQEISNPNRQKRLWFYSMCILNHENFDNVIFTDETSIEVNIYRNQRWLKYSKNKKVSKYKHPLKVFLYCF